MAAGRLFCFGLGFSALTLARALPAGWQVAGTCRSAEACARCSAEGIEAHRFDGSAPPADAGRWLEGATHLLTSVPPDEDGDPVLRQFGEAIAAAEGLRWIGYLSTTGVYGDRGGGWVDEDTPPAPNSPRSRRRAEAEQAWLELWRAHGRPVHVFRLAGIYGPGRSAIDQLRAGTARRIVKPGQVFSRIQVADIANVLLASMARPNPGAVYNVCDDEPAPAHEVVTYAAALLGIEPPPEQPFEDAGLSPMARSFYADNRRVRNDRIKRELGVRLHYPSYREGLRALV